MSTIGDSEVALVEDLISITIMTPPLAMLCATLLILLTIVSTASIDLSKHQFEISLASDAKASSSSRFRLQMTEEEAISAMIRTIPSLGALPGMSQTIRMLIITMCSVDPPSSVLL